MNQLKSLTAKARSAEERSGAIIVSFGTEWYEPLQKKNFKAVIRKRIPANYCPEWLYFHVNSPVGAICARATIREVKSISLREALGLAAELSMETDAIRSYLGQSDSVGCYVLGQTELATTQVTMTQLAKRMVYFPPQSFLYLSIHAKPIIDDLAAFSANIATKDS